MKRNQTNKTSLSHQSEHSINISVTKMKEDDLIAGLNKKTYAMFYHVSLFNRVYFSLCYIIKVEEEFFKQTFRIGENS